MSRYAVQYQSSTKGPLDIESMNTAHLLNAWRKRLAEFNAAPEDGPDDPVLEAMTLELQARGGTYDGFDKWTWPPKEEVQP